MDTVKDFSNKLEDLAIKSKNNTTIQNLIPQLINSLFKGIGFWGYEKSLIHLFVHQALIYRVRGF